MDYVCSLTGQVAQHDGRGLARARSPRGRSTPWPPTADLNNALVSMLLTGYAGFSSAAGFIGPRYRVDHDISLLIPEIWCRLFPHERDPKRLIEAGHLEQLEDYEFDGKTVLASRLGYRITAKFVHTFFGRVFDNPDGGVHRGDPQARDPGPGGLRRRRRTTSSRRSSGWRRRTSRTARSRTLCPPLKALLHIMAHGHYEGKDANHPEVRALFTREALLASDWYHERLAVKQQRDMALWERHARSLTEFLARAGHRDEAERLGIARPARACAGRAGAGERAAST